MHEPKALNGASGAMPCESIALYMRDIQKYEPLSREEEVRLILAARNGDKKALNALITANLRFVIQIAREYQGRGLPLSDLIAEGNLGLIRATETFEIERGFKFITYAVWWIRQAVYLALKRQTGPVVYPSNQVDDANTVNRVTGALAQELGRYPDSEELAEEVDMSSQRMHRAMEANQPHLSIEGAVFDDGRMQYADTLVVQADAPDELLHQAQMKEILEKLVGELPKRDAQILRLYFGLETGDPESLERIGKRFHLTRERIRQIRDRALRQIKRRLSHASVAAVEA